MMPHVDELPNGVLEVVVTQLSAKLDPLASSVPLKADVQIVASLQVWTLSSASVQAGGQALDDLATDTGTWHHQLTVDGKPLLFARSRSADTPEEWTVELVVASPLADELDAAMRWLDETVQDDALGRLLTAPAYGIHALWLVRHHDVPDRVLIVEAARALADLTERRLHDGAELLDRLQDHGPIESISLSSTSP
jgi:hypothetical protein